MSFQDLSSELPVGMSLMRKVLLTDSQSGLVFANEGSKGRFVDGVFEGLVSCPIGCESHSASSSAKVSLIMGCICLVAMIVQVKRANIT